MERDPNSLLAELHVLVSAIEASAPLREPGTTTQRGATAATASGSSSA